MIKVLQVYDSMAKSSGISSVIMGWYNNIEEENFCFDFLCLWSESPSYEQYIKSKGSKVWNLETSKEMLNFKDFISKTRLFFQKHAGEYDIVHLHSSIFCFPILYYAKKYGVKVKIVHVHSSSLGNTKKASIRNWILTIPMKYLADYFWACSFEAANKWYIKNRIKEYKIIPNGIDISKYNKNPIIRDTIRNNLGIGIEDIVLGHISNMSELKNVPFIIELLNDLSKVELNIKLVLIGKEELPVDVKRTIRKYNLEKQIINLGIRDDIWRIISIIDIGLMPSISEGYGIVPLEFQSSRIPVILSTGYPDIVCFSNYAIKASLNKKEWLEIILKIINKQQSFNEKNFSSQYFDTKNITKSVLGIYKKYLNK